MTSSFAPDPATSVSDPVELTLPVTLRIVLSLLAGVLTVLNTTTVHLGGQWSHYVTGALAILAYFVQPVTGSAFQTLLLRLIPARLLSPVHALIAAAIGTASVLIAVAHLSPALTAVLLAVIVVLGGLGFGPAGPSVLQASALPTRRLWRRR